MRSPIHIASILNIFICTYSYFPTASFAGELRHCSRKNNHCCG